MAHLPGGLTTWGVPVKINVLVGAVALSSAAAIAVAGCGGGGASSQPVHGKVLGGTQAAATVVSATGGGTGICGGAVAGTQVIVKGPSGKLLATTTLRKDASATAALNLPSSLAIGQIGVYRFRT